MHSKLERQSPRLAILLKQVETQFKWFFFWVCLAIGNIRLKRQSRPFDPKNLKRVLFLRHDRIGDMVITLPTIHALKKHYPHLEIDVFASPANKSLITEDDSVRQIYIYNKKSIRSTLCTLLEMRRQQYDVVFDPMTGVSITALTLTAFVGSGAFKIGISKQVLGRFYDFFSIEDLNRCEHISEQIEEGLVPFGIILREEARDRAIRLSNAQWVKGETLYKSIKKEGYSRVIGLNISAGRVSRSWNEVKYSELANALASRYPDLLFVVFCAPSDRERAIAVAASLSNVSVIPEGMSIIDVISLMKLLDGMISPDTSICHIAVSVDIPLLALYSSNEHNFKRWKPRGRKVWFVRGDQGDSLDSITAESVLAGFAIFVKEAYTQTAVC